MNRFKRFFLIFIAIIMFLLFIPCVVKADTEISRNVEYKGQDSSGKHIFDYCVYLSEGKDEGTLILPDYIYQNNYWFITLPRNNYQNYVYVWVSPSENLYINASGYFKSSPKSSSDLNLSYYVFDKTTGEEKFTGSNSYMSFSNVKFDLNSILYVKGLNLYRFTSAYPSNIYSWSVFNENVKLKSPKITYLSGKGFRVYLQDFVGNTISDNVYEIIRSIKKLSIKVTDVSTNSIVFVDENILAYSDVQIDTSSRYYIDLLFSDYLTFMNLSDGEYIIQIDCDLNSSLHLVALEDYKFLDCIALYTTSVYVKYNYKKSTNSGILIEVDENGNEINRPRRRRRRKYWWR